MNLPPKTINPYNFARVVHSCGQTTHPGYARLPRVPVNASPVPRLTSLDHFAQAGDYDDRRHHTERLAFEAGEILSNLVDGVLFRRRFS